MSLLTQLFERRSIEGSTVINGTTLAEIFGALPGYTGKVVTPSTAMQLTTVFACVNVISETLSTLPLHLYRKQGGKRVLAENHPLYNVLLDEPNPEMTSVDFINALTGHVLLWGNAYAEIVRNGAGEVKELWPLRPDIVQMGRNSRNELIYQVTIPGGTYANLRANRILHIRGLSFDGLAGYNRVTLGKESIGMAMAAEEFGGRFYSNDASPGGVLEHPGQISKEAADRLRTQWEGTHRGLNNKYRIAVLEEGIKWQQVGIAPENAQYIETRKYQRSEITALFRVQPHKVNDLDKATFSNIEHLDIEFEKNTISPWAIRFEKSIKQRLLTNEEKKVYFAKFSVQGLLRGDIKSRFEAYAQARQNGWMNANEIRALEDANPYDGGDIFMVNSAMVPVSNILKPKPIPAPEPAPAGEDDNNA